MFSGRLEVSFTLFYFGISSSVMAFLGLDQSVVTVVSHADTVCVFDDNIHGDERNAPKISHNKIVVPFSENDKP